MIIVPINTDAPIYHWPRATLGLIVVHVLIGIPTCAGAWQAIESGDPRWIEYALVYGHGLHPVQWLTSLFMQSSFFDLLLSVVFLWGFGLIVEGKIGSLRFLMLYLGIGVSLSAVLQIAMLGVESNGLFGDVFFGPSGVIYALMAMACVWAPRNELTIFYFYILFVLIRVGTFEISVMMFSLALFALQMAIHAIFHASLGFHMTGPFVDLVGAGIGFAIATLMVKKHWVDCENWDLFAVMSNTHGQKQEASPYDQVAKNYRTGSRGSKKKRKLKEAPPIHGSQGDLDMTEEELTRRRASRKAKCLRKMQTLLHDKKARSALSEYEKQLRVLGEFDLPRKALFLLAQQLYEQRFWKDSYDLMQKYITRFPEDADRFRLQLAAILVKEQGRPQAAIDMLQPLEGGQLPQKLEQVRRQIIRHAKQMIDEGVIELRGDTWS